MMCLLKIVNSEEAICLTKRKQCCAGIRNKREGSFVKSDRPSKKDTSQWSANRCSRWESICWKVPSLQTRGIQHCFVHEFLPAQQCSAWIA